METAVFQEPGEPRAPLALRIPTRGERQAMDWSLALASQEVPCVIHSPQEGAGWWLEIDSSDAPRALRTLRLYHQENRDRHSQTHAPDAAFPTFHWGVLLWCALMALVHLASTAPDSALAASGPFDTARTAAGDWWRPLTATFLHHGAEHLAANLTAGFLLLGLAMGRLGAGTALLATLLAGIGGNLFAWSIRDHAYVGVGASGVVMGALGLLALTTGLEARTSAVARAALARGALGGGLLFILLGTSARSDVLAHAGGFLSGALIAALLTALPRSSVSSSRFDSACAAFYALLTLTGWIAALLFF